ncbi:AhpC/TSA family protein [Rubrobacter xylanophilus]|uniref:AhpC/TSA family protein n=1 Tax=Rubrobacter xylanophilus TaxID=49319 RepID=UPI001179E098|nr:AhpC/TSA family protein [Rubrobacter xylanophilus]
MFCRQWVAQLRGAGREFERRGARVALVTPATPEETREFCSGLRFSCLSDPSREAYRAFGIRRGGLGSVVLHPENLRRGMRALAEGHRQGRTAGDVWQLPGAFVIDREGRFRYAHYARRSSDNPPVRELLAALDG